MSGTVCATTCNSVQTGKRLGFKAYMEREIVVFIITSESIMLRQY